MTVDVIHSTEDYIMYINIAILANLQCKSLKLGRLIVLKKTHLAPKYFVPMATCSSPVPTHLISICK